MGVNLLLTGLLIMVITIADFFSETADQTDKSASVILFEKTRRYKITNFIFKCGCGLVVLSLLYLIWED